MNKTTANKSLSNKPDEQTYFIFKEWIIGHRGPSDILPCIVQYNFHSSPNILHQLVEICYVYDKHNYVITEITNLCFTVIHALYSKELHTYNKIIIAVSRINEFLLNYSLLKKINLKSFTCSACSVSLKYFENVMNHGSM